MPHDLHLPPNSPLRQIAAALEILRQTRDKQELALVRYSCVMGVCEIGLRYYRRFGPDIQNRVKNALILLRSDLMAIIPESQNALQTLEANVPLFARDLDFSNAAVREDAHGFLQNIGELLDNVYQCTERLQEFRAHIKGMGAIKEMEAFDEASALLEAIDDSLALSNRHWFCYVDMTDHLRKALS